jgi:hypothetical protein
MIAWRSFKTWINNEKGSKRATLQSNEVLKCLRAKSGHATKNVLKRHQNLLYGSFVSVPSTRSSNYVDPIPFTFNPNASLNSRPSISDNDKLMTKAKMLQIQSKSMAIVATQFSITSNIWNAFLANKVDINNQKLHKMKISNLKIIRHLGVIIKYKFKIGIRLILTYS